MDSKTNQFDLGVKLKDLVSGVTGIAVARLEHLNGCVHYCIKPLADKDGKEIEGIYVDSQQIVKVSDGIRKQITQNNTGGSAKGAPRL